MNEIDVAKMFEVLTEAENNHIARVEDAERQIVSDTDKFALLNLEPVHHFSDGLYARELRIPAGTVITGHIHKRTNLNIMSQGDMSILTADGVVRVQAPYTVVSPPGTKRMAYAHTDCVWTTVHATEETDLDVIEQTFIAKSHEEYLEYCKEQLCLGQR